MLHRSYSTQVFLLDLYKQCICFTCLLSFSSLSILYPQYTLCSPSLIYNNRVWTLHINELAEIPLLLGGDNYDDWRRAIQNFLSSKGLWLIATGEAARPATKEVAELRCYNEKREKAKGYLNHFLDASIQALVEDEDAMGILKTLLVCTIVYRVDE